MATQKQIEANRRNALKSTGPRTVEGKQKASANLPRPEAIPQTPEDLAYTAEVLALLDSEGDPVGELLARAVASAGVWMKQSEGTPSHPPAVRAYVASCLAWERRQQ